MVRSGKVWSGGVGLGKVGLNEFWDGSGTVGYGGVG